ncbi:MAG: DUF6144 family protein [Candidatus Marinimicrobia bacterium]|nr:DUF6144 family protein [Candidatus Neomarinimicrobiota bacterium]
MPDKDRIAIWINLVLQQLSQLDKQRGLEILHDCGTNCSKISVLLAGANKIRNESQMNDDVEHLFKNFKAEYYNSPRLTKSGSKVTLIFKECTCPLVKAGVNNSYLCNCTAGYTKNIFESLFGRPVQVKLIKSILNGDNICMQEILIDNI